MDESLARWLVGPAGREALAEAALLEDPSSVAAAQALRRHWAPEQAAAVAQQEVLRRRASGKFGERARQLFLTADGLEQATRAGVAAWRAARFVAAGARRVVDLGSGIGADALAFADAGLEVVAVELDPVTAVFAAANLGDRGVVHTGDAVGLAGGLLADGDAVFLDPARRTARGRSWRVADMSPPWEWAVGLLVGRLGCVKAGPGIAAADLPDDLAAVFVSDHGDLVEAGLWTAGAGWAAGDRVALLLPQCLELAAGGRVEPPVGQVGAYLHEPDPAVIRAGATARLASLLGAHAVAPGIAYLSGAAPSDSPFARSFAVDQVLPYDERALRAWVRDAGIGTLEIKVRGLDIDPAALRKRLKPKGRTSATLILTPTPQGARAIVTHRVNGDGSG